MTPLILASSSAIRAAMLAGAGVVFETISPGVDEEAVKAAMLAASLGPRDIGIHLAEAKALAVSTRRAGLVIGADQTLDLDGCLHDKPTTLYEARERLGNLRGRDHRLHSAVILARDGDVVWRDCASATLTMRDFSDAFLDAYIDREGEAILSSVGAYRLEGVGAQLFAAIEGDYFTILGLPLLSLLEALRREGVLRR